MELRENQRGRFYLTNKETGEEHILAGDFSAMYSAFCFLEQSLKQVFNINVQYKYKEPEEGKLLGEPIEASAESEQWAARAVTEQLYRQEHNLPAEGE